MKNKKGFTLIEVIAVIVILGVIFLIAIPSVSSIIMTSRKKTYLVDAGRYIEATKNFIHSNNINLRDENITFYIPSKCLDVDKSEESPFGDWKDVYVAVTYDGINYQYYYASTDTEGMGITLTHSSQLKNNSIKPNISSINTNVGVGSRPYVVVFANDCKLETSINNNKKNATSHITGVETTYGNGGSEAANYNITSLDYLPTEWTNGSVTLDGYAKDVKNGIVGYCFTDIMSVSSTTEEWVNISKTTDEIHYTHTVDENGTYYFYTKDGKGNISRKSIRIYNIDREAPECIVSTNKTRFTCIDDNGVVSYYMGAVETPTYINVAKTVLLNKDINYGSGTYYLYAKDAAGNVSNQILNVSASDASKPGITITATNNASTNQTVTVQITDDKSLDKYYFGTTNPSTNSVAFKDISGGPKVKTNIETITAAGTYYAAAKDKEGNMAVQSITFYNIGATSNNTTYGTVSPARQYIKTGGKAVITLSPKAGYRYSSNNCGGTVINNIMTVSNIASDLSCQVVFVSDSLSVTVTSNDTRLGTVSPGTQYVLRGQDAVITLTPAAGYAYASNTCGGVLTNSNTLTIKNVTASKNCVVEFSGSTFLVSAVSNNNSFGTVSPDNQYIVKGNNAIITLSPTAGYSYQGDNCGGTINGNTLTISNVSSPKSCIVVFDIGKYTINASSNNNNFGTVNPATQSVGYDGTAYINLDPKIGYEYKSNDCGATVSSPNVLKISNIKANKTCKVTFGLIRYTVTATAVKAEATGTEVASFMNPKSVTLDHGTNAVFNLTPQAAYKYISDDCGGSANAAGTQLTIPNVVNNMNCKVIFGKKLFTVKAKSNNTNFGTIYPDTQTTRYGETAIITLTPKYTYKYDSNNCGGTINSSNGHELLLTNVTAGKDCTINYTKIRINLSYNSNYGTACSVKTVDMGSQWGTLCTTTRTGYTFQGWKKSNGANLNATDTALENTSVTASWKINSNTVVINANGGGGGTTQTKNYGSTTTASVSRSDHSFNSWSKSGNCGNVSGGASVTYTHPANSGTTCTLTANWTYNPPPPPPEDDDDDDDSGPSCWTDCCWEGCGCSDCMDDPNWPP